MKIKQKSTMVIIVASKFLLKNYLINCEDKVLTYLYNRGFEAVIKKFEIGYNCKL